jgi:glycosyltransferase involved in cell wall biosynthesis
MNHKKIVFFVHCTDITPSTKRRVLDYLPHLAQAPYSIIVKSFTPPGLYKWYYNRSSSHSNFFIFFITELLYIGGGALILMLRFFALIALLFTTQSADIIFLQKISAPFWYPKLLQSVNKNIIYDLDDALFLLKPLSIREIIRVSKTVIVGSHYILRWVQKVNINACLIPTPVPLERFVPKNYSNSIKDSRLIIGWIGSPNTLEHLKLLRPVLDRLADEFPHIIMRIIGYSNKSALLPKLKLCKTECISSIPYHDVPAALREFDIGVMPLIGKEWDKGKCAGKALEYMAAGVPAIASRFGENEYVIEDGKNGFLASDTEEWIEKLSSLIKDADLRKRIGLAGRKTVEEKYAVSVTVNQLLHVIETI